MSLATSPIGWPRAISSIMAMAASTTIVEVDEIRPVGSIEPENVITPAICRCIASMQAKGLRYADMPRPQPVNRSATRRPGMSDAAYGESWLGDPRSHADYLPEGFTVYFHSRNMESWGWAGAEPGEEDYDCGPHESSGNAHLAGAFVFPIWPTRT